MQWYFVENGQQAGPVDESGLAELVAQGRIGPQTLVWSPSMANWQPYAEVAGAAAAAGPAGEPQANSTATMNQVACAECGRAFPIEETIQYGGAYVCPECKPAFFQKIREGVSTGTVQFRYAGFWIRAGAYIIDQILLYVIQLPFGFLAGLFLSRNSQSPELVLLTAPIGMLITLLYYTWFHGKYGQTPGKMACGIRVVRPDGSPISYARALGRYFAYILSGLILGIGYLMAAFDREKRALHDHICDTRVVYK